MATNYPTWNTWDGHGRPVVGYYWGDSSVRPHMSNGEMYDVDDHGAYLVIERRPGLNNEPHRVTLPRGRHFWWSCGLPPIEWWHERNSSRRLEISDSHEMRAIERGSWHPSHRTPPFEDESDTDRAVEEHLRGVVNNHPLRDIRGSFDPFSDLIGKRVSFRVPTKEMPEVGHQRQLAAERMHTMPIDHDSFRHPLQGKPNGQDSEYAWVLNGPLVAMRNSSGSVLVHDINNTKAAIIREESRQIPGGPTVGVVTVNGHIFQWGMHGNRLMYILGEASEPRRPQAVIWPEEAGATRAPGQAEENVVIKLDCGHILDLPFDPGSQTEFYCAPCSGYKTRVFPAQGHPYP